MIRNVTQRLVQEVEEMGAGLTESMLLSNDTAADVMTLARGRGYSAEQGDLGENGLRWTLTL